MKYGAKGRQGGRQNKFVNQHGKEEFDLLTCLLQSSVRISRPKKEGMGLFKESICCLVHKPAKRTLPTVTKGHS